MGNDAGVFAPEDASAQAEMMRSAAQPMMGCLPFRRRSTHHCRRQHHSPGGQTSLKKPLTFINGFFWSNRLKLLLPLKQL
jgi:hypothetical protein